MHEPAIETISHTYHLPWIPPLEIPGIPTSTCWALQQYWLLSHYCTYSTSHWRISGRDCVKNPEINSCLRLRRANFAIATFLTLILQKEYFQYSVLTKCLSQLLREAVRGGGGGQLPSCCTSSVSIAVHVLAYTVHRLAGPTSSSKKLFGINLEDLHDGDLIGPKPAS